MEELAAIKNRSRNMIMPAIVLLALTGAVISGVTGWPSWVTAFFSAEAVVAVIIHASGGKLKKYSSIILTVISWLGFAVYAYFRGGVTYVMPVMFLVVFVFSLYDSFAVNMIGVMAVVLMMIIYGYILKLDSEWPPLFVVTEFASLLLLQYLSIVRQSYEEKKNKRLDESIEKLKDAQSAKDDFLANVSHELRTPLNTIVGVSSDLAGQDLPADAKQAALDILMAGRNLTFLVADIVDFSELEGDRVHVQNDRYSISSVINDLVNMAGAWNSEKHLEIIVDISSDMPSELIGDSMKIYRVILNVLNNAIKFTRYGGVCAEISFRKEEYGGNLCVKVKDTGIGMSEDEIARLNDVYNQADTGRGRTEGGVGLGLPIARKLTAYMNGFIHVESVKGEGSEFMITIPQGVADDTPIVTVNDAAKKKILFYINTEKYRNASVRDWFLQSSQHMAKLLKLDATRCGSVQELKRRTENERYTHVFTGYEEYIEHKDIFDSLALRMSIGVIVDDEDDLNMMHEGVYFVLKPFHVFAIAAALNGTKNTSSTFGKRNEGGFVIKDARVLAVDDSPMNLKVVEHFLAHYGISIDMASDGPSAVEKTKKIRYDLIFLDHMMPGMDGVQTLREIRAIRGNSKESVPVVALTANAVGGAREMLMGEGFDDYIAKPIERSQMERVLRKFLKNKMEKAKAPAVVKPAPRRVEHFMPADPLAALSPEFIDTDIGLGFFDGNKEDYTDILKAYLKEGPEKIKTLSETLKADDIDLYRITVHALKSGSKNIGAMKLFEMAKQSEAAAKAGNALLVREKHEPMIKYLEEVLSDIRNAFGIEEKEETSEKETLEKETSEKEADETEIPEELINKLKEAVMEFDPTECENVLAKIPEGALKDVRKYVAGFDFEAAMNRLKEL